MKKILYIVLSGIMEAPAGEPGRRTPLESALTPYMDRLAQTGKTGLVRTSSSEEGGVIFCVELHAGRDLTAREMASVVQGINNKVVLAHATFEFKSAMGGRGILILRAMHHELSPCVTFADGAPRFFADVARPMPGHEDSPAAVETAALLNEFVAKSRDVLSGDPLGKERARLSLDAADGFWEFLSMSGHPMDIVDVFVDAARADVDAAAGAKSVLKKMALYDILYVPIRGLGGSGRHDLQENKNLIEAIDRRFFGDLLSGLKVSDVIFAVVVRPGSLLISGGRVKPDGSMSFSERACQEGSLGTISAKDLPALLFKFAKK